MRPVRLLLPGAAVVGDLDRGDGDVGEALADLYAYPTPVPRTGWVRVTMVSSLDGSATAADGRSGGLGDAADRAVFTVLRSLADVVLVGSGTARAEGYGPPQLPGWAVDRRRGEGRPDAPRMAVVTRSGRIPGDLAVDPGTLVVTCAAGPVADLRDRLGRERVLVAGDEQVDPGTAVDLLVGAGLRRVLLEGGPGLLGRCAAAGRVDELCLTLSPLLVGGDGPRISHGPDAGLRLRAAHLAECGGTLLGRWLVAR